VLGGYDNRVQENVTYHKELTQLADSLGLKSTTTKNVVTALGVPDDIDVLFLLSVPNSLKDALLKSARLLVYTPSNEHFGIVPLEAMLAGTPVLAANTGGPLETVVDGITGWLCPPDDVEAWTIVMDKVLHKMSNTQLQKMSDAGRQRVVSEFSEVKMAERLENIIENMSSVPRQSFAGLALVLAMLSTIPLLGLLTTVSLWKQYGS
jgi:alpha-1,3/alpha-1,6-mannosyltransferase